MLALRCIQNNKTKSNSNSIKNELLFDAQTRFITLIVKKLLFALCFMRLITISIT